eukprot:TRINITY_DN10536_c0_g1_i1.p2 TRINITY_DN10536_c0_g1~~TRINITY_DN10536_c0_g1_i1.p2  ORF type:complete len:116 (-),score=1.89 TRINITY_DN10536_c0_g1_i1:281-628(-)
MRLYVVVILFSLGVLCATRLDKNLPRFQKIGVNWKDIKIKQRGICSQFTPDMCRRARCGFGVGEPVCCAGQEYDNCCVAVCVHGAIPHTCTAGKCKPRVVVCYADPIIPPASNTD